MAMTNTGYDLLDKAGLELWLRSEAGDNSRRRERLLRNLRRAMTEELSPRQQEILELYYFRDLTVSEIARRLGVNKSTVSRSVRRSCRRLRRFLQYSL